MKKIYDSIFNSIATAIISLIILSGLAVFGLIHLVGEKPVAVVVSVILAILLVNKVINKIGK